MVAFWLMAVVSKVERVLSIVWLPVAGRIVPADKSSSAGEVRRKSRAKGEGVPLLGFRIF